jgi:signal transduction histidine kinase
MKRKQNELYMAFINEVCNESSEVDTSGNISLQETKGRVVRIRNTKRFKEHSAQSSNFTTTEHQIFENAIIEIEKNLAIEKEARDMELARRIEEALTKEREFIGYELHDNINQILATAKLFVEMIVPSTEADKDIQGKTCDLIRRAFEEIRLLSRELTNHDRIQSLTNELQGLVNEIKAAGKFIVRFEHDFNEEFVSTIARKNLFRIAQEQLKNILDYSKAENISISLKEVRNQLFFTITDDGIGFDQKTYRQGLGHGNIFRRVSELNGKAEWNTEINMGCSLMITIPINDK